MNEFFVTVTVLMFLCALTASTVYLFTQKRRVESLNEDYQDELSIHSARMIILSKLQDVGGLALVRSNFPSTVSFEESKKVFGRAVPDLKKIKIAKNFTYGRN